MCYDFGLISGPLIAGSIGSGAAAGGAAAGGAAVGASAVVGGGVTAAGLGSGAIGTGLTAAQLAAAGATSSVVAGSGIAAGTFLTATNVGLAGALLSSAGSIAQGQQQKSAYEANAKMQQMQALDARRRGSMAEGEARQQSKMITGAVNARQGGSGVIAGQDTGLDVLAESAEYGARDAKMLQINAEREAWGLGTMARNDRYQGQMAANAGVYRGGATFLSGFSDALRPTTPPPWWERWKRPSGLPD